MKISILLLFVVGMSYAQELHTHSNAASIVNESNTTSGWGGSASTISVSNDQFSGSYGLKIESPNNGWNYSAYTFATTADEQYIITFYAKSASSTNPALYWGGGGVMENQKIDITSSNWTQYSRTVTAIGSTIAMNIYPGSPALNGESVYIDHFSIFPVSASDTQAPTMGSLTSTGHTATTVDLLWSGATDNVGISQYKVYKDNALVEILGNVTSYQMIGLSASTTYSFAVRALDAAGNQSMASNLSITTASSTDIQSPTAPSLLSDTHTDTTIDLSWTGATDNVGVIGYKIYKDGVLEFTTGNVSTYQVTGVIANTTYDFIVTALDTAGNESANSNQVSVTTDAPTTGGPVSVWNESVGIASYNGSVAIGTNTVPSSFKLAVDGHIRTREIRVDQDEWPDYVFSKDYELLSLDEIKKCIEENGHLPNIPSAKEVEANGMELGKMDRLLLEKVEELTLFAIRMNENYRELLLVNEELREEINILKKQSDEKL